MRRLPSRTQITKHDCVEGWTAIGMWTGVPLGLLLKAAGLTASTSEALRMIAQGGVKLDGEKVADKALKLASGASVVAQVGKRKFARVTVG